MTSTQDRREDDGELDQTTQRGHTHAADVHDVEHGRVLDRRSTAATQTVNTWHLYTDSDSGSVYLFIKQTYTRQLQEQVDTFPYLGSLITEDGECTTEFRTRLNRREAIWASRQKIWKSHSIPISTKIRLMKALVWPVATYTNNEETRLVTSEMKGLRKIPRISWTAKKTNEWVLNKAGVKGGLLDTVKARKLAYYGHTMRKQGSCLEKEIMQGAMPGARRRGRPRTALMDNIKPWTGLSVEESIRMTEDRDKWRKYVHGVTNPRSRTAKEQNTTHDNIQKSTASRTDNAFVQMHVCTLSRTNGQTTRKHNVGRAET